MSAIPGRSTPTGSGPDGATAADPSVGDRMRLAEFVRISTPSWIPWAWQLGSVYVLLLCIPRSLGPFEYGSVTAALSLSLVAAAGSVAMYTGGPPMTPRRAIASSALVLVATPALAALFDLPLLPLLLLAPTMAVSFLTAVRVGGIGRHPRAATSTLGAAAVVRVAGGILLVVSGTGLAGVMIAMLAAEVVGLAVAGLADRHARQPPGRSSDPLARGRRPLASTAAVTSIMLLVQVDLLFAHLRLEAIEAGRYAGAAVLTRMLLFVPLIATLLAVRRQTVVEKEAPLRWLHRMLASAAVAGAAVTIAFVALRAPLSTTVLGPGFGEPVGSFPLLAAAGALFGLVWILSSFHLVVGSRAYILVLAVSAVEVMLLALFARSGESIAVTAAAAAATALLLHYVGARAVARWSPPLTLLRPHAEFGRASLSPPSEEIELSLILPCYNPGPALEDFLLRLTTLLRSEGPSEVIVVSDGSTDDSVEVARRFPSPSIRVIHYPEREGKGHALRVGLNIARGSYVGFIDADGEIDPEAVGPFLSLMRVYAPDLILGSKRHPMSDVSYPPVRRLMSWAYHKLVRLAFRINARDTQTGLKVIRRDVLNAVLPRMFEKRYAFDLELLVVARALGFTKVFEAPVTIRHAFSSTIDPTAVFRILLDTATVFYRRYILDTYRHAGDRLLLVLDRASDPDGDVR